MADQIYHEGLCDIAIAVLAGGESLAAVADELDICRTTLYEWRGKHPEFERAIQKGLLKSQRHWERVGGDGIVGNLEKFAAAPWVFTMKSRFREDYAEEKAEKGAAETLVDKLIDKLCD